MRTSPSVAELFKALARADFGTIHKEGWNDHLGVRFVPLREVLAAVEGALTQAGLVVVQGCSVVDDRWSLTTRLQHVSGEWIETDYPLQPDEGKGRSDAMAIGSAVSYARRHALMALLCLTAEDDDGQGGRRSQSPRQSTERQAPRQQPQEAGGEPPGMRALRKVAAAMPGGGEAFEAYARLHAAGRTAAAWVDSMADQDRHREAEAITRRLGLTTDYPAALTKLAAGHPQGWANALKALDRHGAMVRDLTDAHGMAIYLHLQSLDEDAAKRAGAKK